MIFKYFVTSIAFTVVELWHQIARKISFAKWHSIENNANKLKESILETIKMFIFSVGFAAATLPLSIVYWRIHGKQINVQIVTLYHVK